MKLISIYIPEPYLDALDKLVKKGYYPSRAEAIRLAIKDLIQTEHHLLHAPPKLHKKLRKEANACGVEV
jgi:Arc/MetJ-type ribon-helix-helix transcriptional regulator